MLDTTAVLITDENGTVVEISDADSAGDDVEFLNGILCPGFINAHCHIELSHMQGRIAHHLGLVSFVQQVMNERNKFSTEEKLAAMRSAERELRTDGTVAVGDICNTADSVELKQKSNLYWHNFIEVSGFVDSGAGSRFDAMIGLRNTFAKHPGRNVQSMAPHAPYSVSPGLFKLLNESTAKQITSIHNQEASAEDELYKNKTGAFLSLYKNLGIDVSDFQATGKSSLHSWLPYFTGQQEIICVHNTFTSTEDLKYAMQYSSANLHFCICINANLYIENRLPPVELLAAGDHNIVIGTDSYASNSSLNMMAEIKTIKQYFPTIALEEMLRWATLNGAVALGIDNNFGSFEKGKNPGLVLIDNEYKTRRML